MTLARTSHCLSGRASANDHNNISPKLVASERRDYGSVVSVVHTEEDDDDDDDDDDRFPFHPPANWKSKTTTSTAAAHGDATNNRHVSRCTIIKTPSGTSLVEDLFQAGSIAHSMCVGTTIGVACGVAAYLYYVALEWLLETTWQTLPDLLIGNSSFVPKVLWIPIVGFTLATGVGWVVVHVGEPGDLAYTVQCVHETGCVDVGHAGPMVLASLFSIVAGGSLGPEAPLVAICAALAGFLSQTIFGTTTLTDDRNLLRKHTLMGMAGALAAFFGCPIGGSLFALEINSRFGVEYFEHAVEAVFSGAVCMTVFRSLSGMPIHAIWNITTPDHYLSIAEPRHILYGGLLGLIGAGFAWLYSQFHQRFVLRIFRRYHLLDKENAMHRAWAGTAVVATLGMLIPHTLFWGESEFQTIATLAPANTLPHLWPAASAGLLHFEMHNFGTALTVGLAKLVAISFSVAGGYRGGYIFPLFASGAALGRAIYFVLPESTQLPVQLCVLCMAAALNVAVTRTVLATPLILAYLSGERNALSAILAASLVSLFATAYMPFISTQVPRMDLESSMYRSSSSAATIASKNIRDQLLNDGDSNCSGETEALTPFSDLHKQMDDGDDDDTGRISMSVREQHQVV